VVRPGNGARRDRRHTLFAARLTPRGTAARLVRRFNAGR
jgi:hypothetical protein